MVLVKIPDELLKIDRQAHRLLVNREMLVDQEFIRMDLQGQQEPKECGVPSKVYQNSIREFQSFNSPFLMPVLNCANSHTYL